MGVALICARNKFGCGDIQKVFTYETAVSYLVMRKTVDSQIIAEKLIVAAKNYKESSEFLKMAAVHLSGHDPMANDMMLLDGMVSVEK